MFTEDTNLVYAVCRLQSYNGYRYRGFIASSFSITVVSPQQQSHYCGKTGIVVPIATGFTAGKFPMSLSTLDLHYTGTSRQVNT